MLVEPVKSDLNMAMSSDPRELVDPVVYLAEGVTNVLSDFSVYASKIAFID